MLVVPLLLNHLTYKKMLILLNPYLTVWRLHVEREKQSPAVTVQGEGKQSLSLAIRI